MGFRHGMDADHIAAISDLIGLERDKKQQIYQGLLYAIGHSLVVLCIGIAAAFIGFTFSDSVASFMELLVGVTLLLLGSLIIISMIRDGKSYVFRSRIKILADMIKRKLGPYKDTQIRSFESAGAFVIGIIHGIGAETPTQITLFASTVGIKDIYLMLFQVFVFIVGLFASTLLIVFSVSWVFGQANKQRTAYIVMGLISGLYSIALGGYLVWQAAHNGGHI